MKNVSSTNGTFRLDSKIFQIAMKPNLGTNEMDSQNFYSNATLDQKENIFM